MTPSPTEPPYGIRDIYHIVHSIDKLSQVDDWYDEVFLPRRGMMDDNYAPTYGRMASLVVIADCVIEIMSPRMDANDWAASPIGKFYQRFGRRWYSIAWYVDDVGVVWDRLQAHGVRVIGGGPSSQSSDRPTGTTPIFTSPRDTVTQLQFMRRTPRRSAQEFKQSGEIDPRYLPGWSSDWWATHHPLQVQRLGYITILTEDPAKLLHLFTDALGGTKVHEAESKLTGTQDVYVTLGTQTVLQLSTPLGGGTLAAEDMAKNGPTLHAVAFTVKDLDAAEAHLADRGLTILERDETTLLVDPETTYGAAYRFTTFRAPQDPRD
jgi:catechol 2,3-dioxygenase-like lactoylglutathione lyase family enzyme